MNKGASSVIYKKIIQIYKNKGGKNIRSLSKGYPEPEKLEFAAMKKIFSLDMIIEDEDGYTNYFVIESKYTKEMSSQLLQKWVFLSSFANLHRGIFHIIITKESIVKKITDVISSKKIVAKIITPTDLV